MKKITKTLLTVGAIYIARKYWIIKGHTQCLTNLKKTYGDEIFGSHEILKSKIGPDCFVSVCKDVVKGD